MEFPPRPTNAFIHHCAPLRLGLFDIGGVLYHANYFALLEEAREALLEKHGLPCPALTAKRQFLAIGESGQKFLRPIRYGDRITAALWFSEIRRSSAVACYSLTDAEDAGAENPIHLAKTTLVFAAEEGGTIKPQRLPEALQKAFEAHLGS